MLEMKAYFYSGASVAEYQEAPIPEDLLDEATALREEMVETISEMDDSLLESYLNGDEISSEALIKALRKATIELKATPVFLGSAFKNKAVHHLLDGVVRYLPSPLETPPMVGKRSDEEEVEIKADDNAPFSSLAFKIMSDPYVGTLTFLRIYSGALKSGTSVYNATRQSKEKIGRLLKMHANKREEIKEVYAGDIVAAVGLKNSYTGDTLCAEDSPVMLESIHAPEPVIAISIEPETKDDRERLGLSLNKLATEDPSFKVRTDSETGQTVISGMGELHLEIIVDRLLREFKVSAKIGTPRVAYRETIGSPIREVGKYIRQSGGRGQYGHVVLEVEPNEAGGGNLFEEKIVGGVVPREYFGAVERGVREALEKGPLAKFPVVDVKVRLVDGSYHDVDSSERAFHIAASMATKEAIRKAKPALLEPIMRIETIVPKEYLGDIIGDFTSRRGKVTSMEDRDIVEIVNAEVPLAEMFNYATELRSATQGRATYSMQFERYDRVSASISKEIIEQIS